MRKIVLLFSVLLSFVGVSQVKAETLSEGFESVSLVDADGNALANTWSYGYGLSNGWKVIGGTIYSSTGNTNYGLWTTAHTGSKSLEASYSASNAASVVISEKLTGTLTFWARKTSSSSSTRGYVTLYVAEEDGSTYTVTSTQLYSNSSLTTTWTQYSVDLGTEGVYVAINLIRAAIDDIEAEIYQEADGPQLAVKDGSTKLTSPYSYDFGLVTAGTTKEFTLSNPGTEDLTVDVEESGNFGATLSAKTIVAGGEVTLTVTMPETTGSSMITISPIGVAGIDPFVINVSGTIKDPNKVFVDFADGQMPDDWSNVMIGSYGSGWEVNNGYASHSNSASSYYLAALTSPLLKFTEGEKLYFDVAKYGSSTYNTAMVKVQTSTDGTDWSDLYETPASELVYGTWKTQSVTMPAGNYYIRFYGGYAHITNIYGGELPLVANLKVTASDHNFGLITEDVSTTFTIANSGRATLEGIKVTSTSEAFTITGAPASLEAGESAEVTVTLSAATAGVQSAVISVSATDFDAVTFNVSGYAADATAYTADFAALPDGWENTGWTFGSGYATGSYTSSTSSKNSEMVSPALTVAEGQTLAIEVQGTSSYAELRVYTSADNGTTWTLAKNFDTEARANTSAFTVFVVDGVAAGSYKLKIEGYAVRVRTLNGYALNQNAPALAVTPAEAATFGKVKALPEAKTYTITNTGTGTLEGTIESSDEAQFTVTESTFSLGKGESLEFGIALVFDENYGEKSATITVHPTNEGLSDVTIAATATTADPNIWEEDFEDGELPLGWTTNGWTVSKPWNKDSYMVGAGNSNDNILITPRLQATEGQVLQFEVLDAESSYPLTAEYSTDQETWASVETYTEEGVKEFTAPAAGYYWLRFYGRYTYLDNFYGFKLALPDHIAAISASNIPSYGLKEGVSFNATVTVTESRGVEETLTAKLYMGDEVIGTAEGSVEAKGSVTLTIVATPTQAQEDAEMHIEVEYAGGTLSTEVVTRTVAAAAKLALDENSDDAIETGDYDVVTLTRTFNAGWNTIVLPFQVNVSVFGEEAQAYGFSGYSEENGLAFRSTTTLYQGTPYLLYLPAAISEPIDFGSLSITSAGVDNIYTTKDGIMFQGSFQPVAKLGSEGKRYGITKEGRIMKAGENSSIKGFRAYFELDENNVKEEVKEETVEGDGEVKYFAFDAATGIREVEAAGANETVFDLSGRRVSKAQRGIYIQNGKKVVK